MTFAHFGAQTLRGRSFTAEIAESAENGSGEFGSKPNSESLRVLRDLCGEIALRREAAVVTRGLEVCTVLVRHGVGRAGKDQVPLRHAPGIVRTERQGDAILPHQNIRVVLNLLRMSCHAVDE